MNISVVICTCNRAHTIERTIASVLANTVQPPEIIIVDQSDENGQIEKIIRKIDSKVMITRILCTNKGAALARNIGWKNAKGDFIVFLDDDAHIDSNCFAEMLDVYTKTQFNPGIVGGKVIAQYESVNPNWCIPKKWAFLLPSYDRGEYCGKYVGGELPASVCIGVRKELLELTSGFNETIGPNVTRNIQIYGEDSDFALKVKSLGYDLIYNSKIVTYHPVPLSRQSKNYLLKRLFSEGITQAYLLVNNNTKLYSITMLMFKIYQFILFKLKLRIQKKADYLYEIEFKRGEIYMLWRYGILKKHSILNRL